MKRAEKVWFEKARDENSGIWLLIQEVTPCEKMLIDEQEASTGVDPAEIRAVR